MTATSSSDSQGVDRRRRAAVIVGIVIIVFTILVSLIGSAVIGQHLQASLTSSLETVGISDVDVAFTGREAVLTSRSAPAFHVDAAEKIVAGTYGVRWVTVAGDRGPVAGEPPAGVGATSVELVDAGSTVTISGTVPTQEDADRLLADARKVWGDQVVSTLKVDAGLAPGVWLPQSATLFAALKRVDRVDAKIDGDSLRVTGSVATKGELTSAQSAIAAASSGTVDDALVVDSASADAAKKLIAATSVYFEPDSSAISPQAATSLTAVAVAMRDNPSVVVRLDGNIAFSAGSPADDVAFSVERATAVATFLRGQGVPANQLQINGLGMSEPVAANETPEGAASNRRVTFHIQEG